MEGESPLHLAVREGVELAVNILISAGADPTRVNLKLETPLHLAADIGFAGYYNLLHVVITTCLDFLEERD